MKILYKNGFIYRKTVELLCDVFAIAEEKKRYW